MASNISNTKAYSGENEEPTECLDNETVAIAGGGPVGLILATTLAKYGIKSVIFERNETTTKWPKMDLTNARSMELLRRLGLVDDIRRLGVSDQSPYRVLMLSGLHAASTITSWDFPSVDEIREEIRTTNDGSMPLEPWQRISQEVFERYLKARCDENPLIDCRFGWKVEKSVETDKRVVLSVNNIKTGQRSIIWARYLAGCDGASSRTRRDMEIPLDGGPVPGYTLLVHFESRDLKRLFRLGRFWHLFICSEQGLSSAAICQDDDHVFTTHLLLPLDADHESIDSQEAVFRALGGIGGPFEIDIDKILVRSTYRHSIAIARQYRSRLGKVFLAGDAAHQNIPTGGYGMNMGIGDAFDLGWKLAATIRSHAGASLLQSYEEERRPVALMCIQRSGVHMEAHMALTDLLKPNAHLIDSETDDGQAMRSRIHDHYQAHRGENTDVGVEMDHRHESVVYPQDIEVGSIETAWDPARYAPSTSVGSRAPHVFLRNGMSIFDHYGEWWTLFEFMNGEVDQPTRAQKLLETAEAVKMPVKHVVLHGEVEAHRVWQARLVLVRPDGHVAWRGKDVGCLQTITNVLRIVAGYDTSSRHQEHHNSTNGLEVPFAATKEVTTQVEEYQLQQMGGMQA